MVACNRSLSYLCTIVSQSFKRVTEPSTGLVQFQTCAMGKRGRQNQCACVVNLVQVLPSSVKLGAFQLPHTSLATCSLPLQGLCPIWFRAACTLITATGSLPLEGLCPIWFRAAYNIITPITMFLNKMSFMIYIPLLKTILFIPTAVLGMQADSVQHKLVIRNARPCENHALGS